MGDLIAMVKDAVVPLAGFMAVTAMLGVVIVMYKHTLSKIFMKTAITAPIKINEVTASPYKSTIVSIVFPFLRTRPTITNNL